MPKVRTRDGVELYVKSWGEGRPVILMHGWPLNADTWDDHAVALAEAGYRAISYDRRGFGRSEQPWSGYDYDTLADDLAAVIEQSGAQDAALVGFSMAGGEIARYMSRHGGKGVAQAALISSVVPYLLKTDDNPDGVPEAVFETITAGLKTDRPKFYDAFFKAFYGIAPLDHSVSGDIREWSRDMAMLAGLRPTLACAQAFSHTDFRPDLPAFTVPTLIIHGTHDKTVPIDPTGRAAAKAIGQSRLIEYDGAPHGVLATHKDRVKDDLLGFLRA